MVPFMSYLPLKAQIISTIQIVRKHMKRCSMSLIIREMLIKTTMRYHLPPFRMAIINKSTKNKCWQCCEKSVPSCTVGGISDQGSHCENSMDFPQKKIKMKLLYDLGISLLEIYPKKPKTPIQRMYVTLCSLHYLQQPIFGSSPNVHQQMNG